MIIHLPEDVASSIRAEVLSGHFASADDVVAVAVRDYLQRKSGQSSHAGMVSIGAVAPAADELSSQELQRRLLEAGVISEIKPPITDLTPYRDRQAVSVQGPPLSESIIRERR